MWAMAQTITVSPYLQDASPHEISILWETNENPESTVEWGLTEMLGTSTSGSVMSNNGAQLHQVTLADLNEALNNRLGSLKELFGVLQQVSGDTKNKFYNSVVSAQIPGRSEFLDTMAQDMGKSSKLASIAEIERVWFEIQREMTEL